MSEAVLVTGGAGYIGSHVCLALATAGYLPVSYDTLEQGHAWAAQWGPLEVGDIRESSRLLAVIERYRPIAVVHCAAYTSVADSVSRPQIYESNNVGGTKSLLRAMGDGRVKALVYSSSCSVYGQSDDGPLDESAPARPVSPYGASKLAAEQAIGAACNAGALRHVTFRYFNAAGADPRARIGEAHRPETHLVPLAIGSALGIGRPLTVMGTDYKTPDGTCIRDYVHVMDIAEAHVRALGHILEGGRSATYNLGSGRGYSVRDIIAAIESALNRPVPHETGPRRPGDPDRAVADTAAVARELGWAPSRALADIIADALRWHQKQISSGA